MTKQPHGEHGKVSLRLARFKTLPNHWLTYLDVLRKGEDLWVINHLYDFRCTLRIIGPSKLPILRTETPLRHTGSFTLPLEGPRSLG